MSLNYSNILSKAWTIAWKYKVLWFFGFLAALGGAGWGNSGGGGSSNFNFNSNSNSNSDSSYRSGNYQTGGVPREWQSAYNQLSAIDINTWISIAVVVVCCLLLLGVVFWLLSIVGRGGLIGGIVAAETNGKVAFREAWEIGTKNFWRLFLIRLLRIAVSILIFILSMIFILPGLVFGVLTCGFGFILMFIVSIILGVAVSVWFTYMDYAVIVEKIGVGEAIGRAWSMLRDNVGPIALLVIILFAVSLGVGLGLLILFAPSGVVIFLSMLPLITETGSLNMTLLIAGIVLLVLFIVASWIVQAVLTVWETAVMVLAYRVFISKTPLPALPVESQPQITSG
jgi:hypothetical protein